MYFYCWVEICTDDVECAQRCTLICECFRVYLKYKLDFWCFIIVSLFVQHLREKGKEDKPNFLHISSSSSPLGRCCKAALKRIRLLVRKKTQMCAELFEQLKIFSPFAVFHGWLYLLPAVGAALVLVLLIVWLKFRCQKTEGQQTYDVHSEQAQ